MHYIIVIEQLIAIIKNKTSFHHQNLKANCLDHHFMCSHKHFTHLKTISIFLQSSREE